MSRLLSVLALLGLCLSLSTQAVRAADAPDPIVVVVSASVGKADISMGTLRRVFSGDVGRLGGMRLIPFNYGHGDGLRQAFDRRVLGLEPEEIGRYWIDRRIRGQGVAPRTVPSRALMAAVVRKLPGAIGYLHASDAAAGLRVLTVDGKAHGSTDYPLR